MVSPALGFSGVLLIALSLVLGAPVYPGLVVASFVSIFILAQYAWSGTKYFKAGATFRLAFANVMWAGASGSLVGLTTGLLWAGGFGSIGYALGRHVEAIRLVERRAS